MVDVIKQIQPSVVLPMHHWGRAQLDRFLSLMSEVDHDFVWPEQPVIDIRKNPAVQVTVIAVAGNGGGRSKRAAKLRNRLHANQSRSGCCDPSAC